MLITNDKCTDGWKTVKAKSNNNTNIASPTSVSPKNPSPINLQNRFDNLNRFDKPQNRFDKPNLINYKIDLINQIEIHEPYDHTPSNHHKRCEITNTKSKLRVEKNNSHSIRPTNAITNNQSNTESKSKNSLRTVAGNQSYAGTTKYSKKHVSWAIVIYAELKRIYLMIQYSKVKHT